MNHKSSHINPAPLLLTKTRINFHTYETLKSKKKTHTLHLGQHHLMSLCAFQNIQILHFLDETNIDVGNFTHKAAISSVSFAIFKFHSCGKLTISIWL
jgi:hypothetical protein